MSDNLELSASITTEEPEVAATLSDLRYLVFQGMKGEDGERGPAALVPAYIDADVIRYIHDYGTHAADDIYTSLLMRTDIGNGILPFVLRGIESDSAEEYFELDHQAISAASPVIHFRSREHLLAVDSTGHSTLTDRPQGGGTSADAVLYTQQTPTDAQKAQARENIGAAGADDVAADFAARDRLMQKCAIVVDSSPNRWNKEAAATGLLGLDGRLYTGGSYDNYCYYNIGSVSEGDVITAYLKRTTVETANMIRVVCYDSGGNAVVSAGTSTATQSFTVPSGVSSVAICTTKNTGLTYNYMILVNAESAPTDYIPYIEHNVFYRATEDFLPKTSRLDKVNTLLGSDSPSASAATLASGTTLAIDNAPYFIKKNVSVSARMEFETFTSIEIGKGQNSYRGKSAIVDSTNITMVSYNDSGTAVNGNSVAHGLTVSDYLRVTMHLGDDGKCEVTINTTSGTFTTTFDFFAEWNYSPFVVGAQAMTDVQLGYSCSDIRCPMWIFGDSYLGLYDNRVGGQLRQLGFFNFALVGVAGGRANDGSKATYPDLQRMLALGTPKCIIWALGMNGGDNVNIAFLPTLMKLCEDKDIELILYKVPSIPTIDHTSLNTFIESTGLRYIDGAAAVGADASGNWYADMISSDGVHPSVLGAKALAMRYLTDVPEIMQYGKSGEGGAVESVNGQTGAVTVKTPYYLTVTTENGTTYVDKTPAEIDALSVAGYDVHMRLPMTVGEYTAVGDMRYFATIGISAFYGLVWFGNAPLIATARVTEQKIVNYELTFVVTEGDIIRIENALTDKADKSDIPSLSGYATETWVEGKGYQTAQDVQTAIKPFEIHIIADGNGGYTTQESAEEIIAHVENCVVVLFGGSMRPDTYTASANDAELNVQTIDAGGTFGNIVISVAENSVTVSLNVINLRELPTISAADDGKTPIVAGGAWNLTSEFQNKGITDPGGYFTTDTVEGALQEIGSELAGVNTLIGTGVIT